MAFDWSKINFQQLMDLASKQHPEFAQGPQRVNRDEQDPSAPANTYQIDLSSLGIPGHAEVSYDASGKPVFAIRDDPSGSGHSVRLDPGNGGSVAPSYFNRSNTSMEKFLDTAVPVALTLGAGAIAAGAAAVGGAAAGTSEGTVAGGAIGSSTASIPADISSELVAGGSNLSTVSAADIATAGGGSLTGEGSLAAGGGAGGLFGDGGGLLQQGQLASETSAIGTGPIGSGVPSITAPTGIDTTTLGSGLQTSDIATAGGGTTGLTGVGGGGPLSGEDQLANETNKLVTQNAADTGSLLNTNVPTYDTTGGSLLDSLGSLKGGNLLSSGANLLGNVLQGQTAGNVAGTLSGGSTQAGNLLSDAALKAAGINATASTDAAKALAAAATGAGSNLSAADLAAGGMLAAGYNTAAQQQEAAIRQAMAANDETLKNQQANQQPFYQAGTDALSQLEAGLKPGGQYNRAFTMADAQNMPAYQFALQQGQEAINNAAAAGGTQLSSANLQSLGKYAEGTAAQYEQQAFNQWLAQNNMSLSGLQNMVSTGQISAGQLQTALAQHGISAETFNQNIGNAEAAGTLGAAEANAQAALSAAEATNAGNIAAANANAAGTVGSAGFTAGGITNSANARAGGLIGATNAQAGGQVAKGNAIGSGINTLSNGIVNSGILNNLSSIFGSGG